MSVKGHILRMKRKTANACLGAKGYHTSRMKITTNERKKEKKCLFPAERILHE